MAVRTTRRTIRKRGIAQRSRSRKRSCRIGVLARRVAEPRVRHRIEEVVCDLNTDLGIEVGGVLRVGAPVDVVPDFLAGALEVGAEFRRAGSGSNVAGEEGEPGLEVSGLRAVVVFGHEVVVSDFADQRGEALSEPHTDRLVVLGLSGWSDGFAADCKANVEGQCLVPTATILLGIEVGRVRDHPPSPRGGPQVRWK